MPCEAHLSCWSLPSESNMPPMLLSRLLESRPRHDSGHIRGTAQRTRPVVPSNQNNIRALSSSLPRINRKHHSVPRGFPHGRELPDNRISFVLVPPGDAVVPANADL